MNKFSWPLLALALTACNDANQGRTVTAKAPEPPDLSERTPSPHQLSLFHCNSTTLVLEVEGDKARLYLDGQAQQVSPIAGGFGNDKLRFTLNAEGGQLSTPEGQDSCQRDLSATPWDLARNRGVEFRALGNEPGWSLEIGAKGLLLSTDYGQRTLSGKAEPYQDGAITYYKAKLFEVALSPGPCSDDMSGEEFDTQVQVRLDGQVLRGCGNSLK